MSALPKSFSPVPDFGPAACVFRCCCACGQGYPADHLPMNHRARVLAAGRAGHVAGLVVYAAAEGLGAWIWLPWELLAQVEGFIPWDERLTCLEVDEKGGPDLAGVPGGLLAPTLHKPFRNRIILP